MNDSLKTSVVITSIGKPNEAMRVVAEGCAKFGWQFLVIGDTKSPADFKMDHCEFYSVDQQIATGGTFAKLCPTKHYTRKNIGYVLAVEAGAKLIIDTDDDTLPNEDFWKPRVRQQNCSALQNHKGWVNAYRFFADDNPAPLWPRGLPLNEVHAKFPDYEALPKASADCPIQQALINEDPDVDAVYRLILPLPRSFNPNRRVILSEGSRCPFNSQNTTFWEDVFPLLYLPAYCSFRMSDIWRSFVAQRVAWANGWSVLFTEPTTWHDRNAHNLMKDFSDEIPGYMNNDRIMNELEAIPMKAGKEHLHANVAASYARLVALELVGEKELPLLQAWQDDMAKATKKA